MAIAGNFDDKSDAGFVRAYDARPARRQFQIRASSFSCLHRPRLRLEFCPSSLPQLPPAVSARQTEQPSHRGNVTGHSPLT
jgi:hypothetical protein